VFTWVDATKFNHIDKKDKASYTDNNELLYSLRSIEKYAPFYRKIYIVLHDNQLPDWIVTDYPKLKIIYHSEFIPSKYLPTYNSLSIESFLHYIPGLSENYIYFNDDMILLNPISPSIFFDSKMKPIESKCILINSFTSIYKKNNRIYYKIQDSYKFNEMISFNYGLLKTIPSTYQTIYQSQHIPSANKISYQKSLDTFLSNIKIKDTQSSILEHTKSSQYRQNDNIARYSLFKKYWNIIKYQTKSRNYPILYIEINHLVSNKDKINSIGQTNDLFLCIQNNIAYGDINEEIGINDYKLLNQKLQELLPYPSRFEQTYYSV
jgi:hypothetical protein